MTTAELFPSKEACCGCSACANVCPVEIIHMVPDEEGFLYPQVGDASQCLHCGKCTVCCPVKHAADSKSTFIEYYAGSIREPQALASCASGGAATAIAGNFIEKGGVVYGAAYSQDWKRVEYCRCTRPEELERLKTSKYAQAEKGTVYKRIEADLKAGSKVLFIGMPCDVAAVKRVLSRWEETLYTAELICHGPTSGLVHSQYCDRMEKKLGGKLSKFSTRHKRDGKWKPFYIMAAAENGKCRMQPFHESSYGAAFRYLKRPSCYVCTIKGEALRGDIMLGDYHYVETGMKGYNPGGVSSILVHNEKGKQLLDIDDSFDLVQISKRCAEANRAIFRPIPAPEGKEKFGRVFVEKGLQKAGSLPMVRLSNFQRAAKATVLKWGVRVKRLLRPSSAPKEE